MPPPEPGLLALARRQHQVFSRAQALHLGFSRRSVERRLRTGTWVRLHPGVYVLGGVEIGWRQRLSAALIACGDVAVASHRSAGRIWELADDDATEITIPGTARRRVAAVRVHRSDVQAVRHGGFPVTRPDRTIIDLASVLDPDDLATAFDRAHRKRLVHPDRIAVQLDLPSNQRRRGTGVLREIVAIRLGHPALMSELETRFYQALRQSGLPLPVPQHPVMTRAGRRFIDFAYIGPRLAIETDGWGWHGTREDFERDSARRNELELLGWRVLTVTHRMLRIDAEDVAFQIGRGLGLRPKRWA